jgi:hypothetical protein
MTAQPARSPLALVAPAGSGTTGRRSSETVLRQWDPEAQLVGALMHVPAARAAQILDVVPDSAIWQPDNRWAIEIIRHLIGCGFDPDPVTVLHAARHRRPADTTAAVSARRYHRFAVHLADLYTQTIAPVLAGQHARDVLEDAFRRATEVHATRLARLAESGADRNELAPTSRRCAPSWPTCGAAPRPRAQRHPIRSL